MEDRYLASECVGLGDYRGLHRVFDIPGSLGKEVRVCVAGGGWAFSRHTLLAAMTSNAALNSGWWLPLAVGTGAVPPLANRIATIGGPECVGLMNPRRRFRHRLYLDPNSGPLEGCPSVDNSFVFWRAQNC